MLTRKINSLFHKSVGIEKGTFKKVKFNYALQCLDNNKARIKKGYFHKNGRTFYGFKVYFKNTSWHFPNFALSKKEYNKLIKKT